MSTEDEAKNEPVMQVGTLNSSRSRVKKKRCLGKNILAAAIGKI